MTLPRPGLLGILVRLALAAAVGSMGYSAIFHAAGFWDGYEDPLASLSLLVPLVLLSSWVVNELLQRSWRWWPSLALLLGAALAVGAGALKSDAFGPAYGIYLWAWTLAFSLLLGPAFVLAAVLRTPGCEMRAYAHLWAMLRGGDVGEVACPGWIDRLDRVRVLGRW